MSGYNLIRRVKYLEEECHKLGFQLGHSLHFNQEFGDVVALKPRDDCLPVYSRDAEVFIGTLESLEHWLQGLHFARKYDSMLMGKNFDAQRQRKEQDYRNRQLLNKIKGEKEAK
jgi:hypothetical protein